jgi:hypothetical protein
MTACVIENLIGYIVTFGQIAYRPRGVWLPDGVGGARAGG